MVVAGFSQSCTVLRTPRPLRAGRPLVAELHQCPVRERDVAAVADDDVVVDRDVEELAGFHDASGQLDVLR